MNATRITMGLLLTAALALAIPAFATDVTVRPKATDEAWFGAPIPASGYDSSIPDCGMTAARIFDAPIEGLKRIGTLVVPKSADLPETSNASIGFECLDRGLFDPDRCYDTLAAAGIKWARVQTMWCRCEKQKGVYDFTVLDGVVDNLTRRGVRPWFCVTFGNTLYMTNCFTGAAVGCVPTLYGDECRAAWCAYVRELAKRYKGKVSHWEIWNEPNNAGFWRPSSPNAAEYLELVKLTGGVVREVIPDAKVGGTTAAGALGEFESDFFELGGAAAIDFWCNHAYACEPERLRWNHPIAFGETSDYVVALKNMRKFIDGHGGRHVEIWQGESGFPSWFPAGHWLFKPDGVCKEGWQSQANQAKWLLRRFVTDRRAGIVRSSFFQMADISRQYSVATVTRPHPAEHGIVNGWTYEPKMSCRAFGNYNALLATAIYDDSVNVSLTPVSDGGAPTVAAAFRTANGSPLFLYYTAFDFSGNYTGTCYTARCDAKLAVPAALAPKDPVLVDMLRGGVYSVSTCAAVADGFATFSGLPLVDYPLVLMDRANWRRLSSSSSDNARMAVVEPTATGEALINPDMGFVYYHYSNRLWAYGINTANGDTLDWFPGCSTIYYRLLWNDLEPEEGEYRWDIIDSTAQNWIAKGKKIAIRVICCNQTETAVPQYVRDAGAKGDWFQYIDRVTNAPLPPRWCPNYDDPVFLAKHEKFLKAMARCYDGNPAVAFIDVGSYGLYGEGHHNATHYEKLREENPAEFERLAKIHLDLYKRCFPNTYLVVSDDLGGGGWLEEAPGKRIPDHPLFQYCRSLGIGLRDDSIMCSEAPNLWLSDGYARMFAPKWPVVLETGHIPSILLESGRYSDESYVGCVEAYQASYMSIHDFPKEHLRDFRKAIDEINLRLGYRFELREADFPSEVKAGERFTIKSKWVNTGVAPRTKENFLSWSLINDDDTVAWTVTDDGFDFRRLEPKLKSIEKPQNVETVCRFGFTKKIPQPDQVVGWARKVGREFPDVVTMLKPGEYTLAVSVGSRIGTPEIALPLEGQIGATRRYAVGKVKVER